METTTSGQAVTIDPVGLVENSIKEPILFSHEKGLEMQGQLEQFWKKVRQVEQVESKIIIDPERSDLLEGIDAYSHLLVIYWGHKTPAAGRTLNQVHPMGRKDLPLTGVFTTCSPARPNPVLMTVVELLGRQDNILTVRRLDAIDQSPVLDIKPYVKELFPQEGVRTPDWMRALMQEAAERRGSA